MKKLGYPFLLGGVLSLLTVLIAAIDWRPLRVDSLSIVCDAAGD